MKKILNIKSHYQKAKAFYKNYERWLMPATLVIGFLVDYITFTSIQIAITFTLLFVYWAVAGATIIFINLYDAGKITFRVFPRQIPRSSAALKYARLFAPLVLQFTFGALLSTSLVFYWVSGAFSVSWPIVVIVAAAMISNDIFRHYLLKPVVQASVYFFTTFSLLSLVLPFIFKSLDPWVFGLAGALSMALFYPYIRILFLAGDHIKEKKRHLLAATLAIFCAMNVLYFTNIIPPIPLSLREAGLYHSLKISNGSYTMLTEPETFLGVILPGQTVHVKPADKIYFYTSIFAPTHVDVEIFDHWQYYDAQKKNWVTQSVLSFPIIGGRKEGYKGYSFRSNLAAGDWRIFVKNKRGQVLGRMNFAVQKTEGEITLQEVVK